LGGEGWQIQVAGSPMFRLYFKLKAIKKTLRAKNIGVFGGIKEKVARAKEKLDCAQRLVLQSRGRAECLHRENECLHEYSSISKAEEAFFKQKSRNNWLNLGDQNTSYFHNLVKVRNSKNTINQLWDDQGLQNLFFIFHIITKFKAIPMLPNYTVAPKANLQRMLFSFFSLPILFTILRNLIPTESYGDYKAFELYSLFCVYKKKVIHPKNKIKK
jgi:hypothetical protein